MNVLKKLNKIIKTSEDEPTRKKEMAIASKIRPDYSKDWQLYELKDYEFRENLLWCQLSSLQKKNYAQGNLPVLSQVWVEKPPAKLFIGRRYWVPDSLN